MPSSRSTNIERVYQLASLFSSSFKRAYPRVLTSTVSELCRSGPRPYLLYPMFSFTKTSMHSDLLVPSFSNDFYTEVGKDPTWEGKRHNKVLWRGETTGAWHAQGSGWRNTQRARLVARESTLSVFSLDRSPKLDSLLLFHSRQCSSEARVSRPLRIPFKLRLDSSFDRPHDIPHILLPRRSVLWGTCPVLHYTSRQDL